MISKAVERSVVHAFAYLVLLAMPGLLYGDASADFDRLKNRLLEQYRTKKCPEAEQTAVELRQLAEGPLKHKPELLGLAFHYQAVAVHEQGRYAEAEKLHRRSPGDC